MDISLIQELAQVWRSKEDTSRREKTEEIYQTYMQNWKHLLIRELRKVFSESTVQLLIPQADTSLNLLKWVTDELSQIYTEAPTRSLDPAKDADHQKISWYESRGKLNLALDRAVRLCFALRELVIRPHVVKGELNLELITPDRVAVLPEEHDLTKIKAIVIQHSFEEKRIWTKEKWYVCDNSFGIIQENPNPYGFIPYLVAHASFPAMKFWHHEEAFGLRDLTLRIAMALTDHAHLSHLQSFKQVWIKADEMDEGVQEVVLDPSRILRLQGNSSVGTIDLATDFQKHLDSILSQAAAGVALWGLRSEQLRGTLDVSSGYALSLKLMNQIKVWNKQRQIWKVWEAELYSLAHKLKHRATSDQVLEINFHPLIETESE